MKEHQIKSLLISYLLENTPDLILGSEVPFLFGSRRADIISIQDEIAIVYEIKSAKDSLEKLVYQIEGYKSYFDYCFIVCEEANLNQIRKTIKKDVGIVLVDNHSKIEFIRKSKRFKLHDKISLASTIPRDILKKMIDNNTIRTKIKLCQAVSEKYPLQFIRNSSRKHLLQSYHSRTQLLKSELGKQITADDIITITRAIPNSYINNHYED